MLHRVQINKYGFGNKNQMTIPKDTQKFCFKTQYPFMIKAMKRIEIEIIYLI